MPCIDIFQASAPRQRCRENTMNHVASIQAPLTVGRPVYLAVLTWAFTLFNSLRAVSYLPTMWAIQASGESSQHSLWTWCTWLGANVTMAAWLYEQNGQRLGRAVIVNIGNATMCAVTVALIVAHRSWVW
jgi:hypothetical protein